MSESIKIISKEGKEIEIPKDCVALSELLKGTIDDYPENPVLPLKEIEHKTIEKVKEFLLHYKGTPPKEISKPLTDVKMENVTDEFSSNFVNKLSLDELIELTVAANFMSIQSLLDLCCAKIASMCKDKTEDEIYREFGVSVPISDEEKERIRNENSWIEENI